MSRVSRLSPYVAPAVLALVMGGMVAIMLASRRDGHWWGDDWALYIRQAEGLLDGRTSEVFADNRFTVESSRGAPFSPPLYPWGFPFLLAPAIAVLGRDIDQLSIVQVISAVVFACSWYALARPRLGTLPAIVGVVAVTMTPLLLGWTELIQSEWPFLAVTFAVLVGLDRIVARGDLVGHNARIGPLMLLGLGAFASFSVRKEGLALTAAIAAAQLAAIIAASIVPWRLGRRDGIRLFARLSIPHVTALASVLVLQWLLPSTLVPRYEGTGIGNIKKYFRAHVEHIAEVSGLKRAWDTDPVVLGSVALGWVVIVAFFTAALVGAVLAITRNRDRDLHLLVYAMVAFVIGASFRGALNRYVVTVAPILLLLGAVGVATLVGLAGRPRVATAAVSALLAAIAMGNLANANVRVDRASATAATGTIEWGPTHPAAVEMFEWVEANTDPDDIIAAPKARAMTLLTDRRSVQVDDHRPIPDDVDIALVVTQSDSTIADELARSSEYALVWSNGRFDLYRPR